MNAPAQFLLALIFSLTAGHAGARQSGGCPPNWLPTFEGLNATNGEVLSFTVFDDGSGGGPELYVGGSFDMAGVVPANSIAKWNGTGWSALGSGMIGGVLGLPSVFDLIVFNDGSGDALYAAGDFSVSGGGTTQRIAKWDGVNWSPLQAGVTGTSSQKSVNALAVFDDGNGPALYAGGNFTTAGFFLGGTKHIARWDGHMWSPLGFVGGGVNDIIHALAVFDDGSGAGPALYAAGDFTAAGTILANHIAKWDGTSWSSLGFLGAGTNGRVNVLEVFDDGSGAGPALYIGGDFTVAGTILADRIAKWDGTSWSSLGFLGAGTNGSVHALEVFDDGSGAGPALHVGGDFTVAGTILANRIAWWDGSSWSTLGSGINVSSGTSVRALAVFDEGTGSGPDLYAGGLFATAGGLPANHMAQWGCSAPPPLTRFCTAKTALVCGAAYLGATGNASATATSGFVVAAQPVRGCRPGLLLYSNQPVQLAVSFGGPGNGSLCLLGQGLRRAGPIESGGTSPSFCDGVFSVDMNQFYQLNWTATGCNPASGQHNPAGFLGNMGTTVSAQMWGRDSSLTGQVLSDGISWVIGL